MLVLTNSSNSSLEKELGPRAALLKEYTGVQIGNVSINHPKFYDVKSLITKQYGLPADYSLVEKIYRDLSNFSYDPTQSDPYLINTGANCQAISIVLKETLERNGIPASYVLTDGLDHMYVEAHLEGTSIELDLVQKKFLVKEESHG